MKKKRGKRIDHDSILNDPEFRREVEAANREYIERYHRFVNGLPPDMPEPERRALISEWLEANFNPFL